MQEQNLFIEYKKYDYLNQGRETPLIKILVSYIKPSFLFKSEILTPIHLGRAVERENSKDGIVSDDDIKWLHENCIGDNDFEGNISNTNRRVGFFTGTYWAWKNYEKLGNPEYFGNFGYRKLLEPYFLNNLKDFDAFLPKMEENPNNWTNKERYAIARGEKIANLTRELVTKYNPKDIQIYDEYFNLKIGFYHEIYVLKKELFFEYCKWLYPFLLTLLKYTHDFFLPTERNKLSPHAAAYMNENRDIAFVIERLTGFYCYKLSQSNIKIKEIDYIYLNKLQEQNKQKRIILNLLRTKHKTKIKS